jgi:putative Holliday junction resolvase
VRLALDIGTVRIGVARSDVTGTLAVPETTLDARKAWLTGLGALVAEWEPLEIIVGLPLSLDGTERAAAQKVRDVVASIRGELPGVPIRLVDERHTTTVAQTLMRDAGIATREGRRFVDQAAAVMMLQQTLDIERSTGQAPGELANGN